jgi:DUF1680 family protein
MSGERRKVRALPQGTNERTTRVTAVTTDDGTTSTSATPVRRPDRVDARPADLERVRFAGGFWGQRQEVNRTRTLPSQYKHLVDTHRIDALDPAWRPGDPQSRHIFWDSDVAKWLEAAAYSLTTHRLDPELAAHMEDTVERLLRLQDDDGYLNSWFQIVEPDKRWSHLRDKHELYCAGHLMEAAVAHAHVTGDDRLLAALRRTADYVGQTFGTQEGQRRGYPGHEEIELALVKLYRATGAAAYLDLARYFIDERGRADAEAGVEHYYDVEARERGQEPEPHIHGATIPYDYCQAHVPVRQQERATGHAVRAMYLYSAMTDLVAEGGDVALEEANLRLWENVSLRQMYVTGSVGASGTGERFTHDFDLPEETSYCETCAAIGLVFWSRRLVELYGERRFSDVMERALYNGVLAGVSLDGERYFYVNPLASRGAHHRQDWFGCACCPPNIARLIAGLGHYAYSEGEAAWVHLYATGEAQLRAGTTQMRLRVTTDYPWDGRVEIEVETDRDGDEAELNLRLPGWCQRADLRIGTQEFDVEVSEAYHADERGGSGYIRLQRKWSRGERIELTFDMEPRRVWAHPSVRMAAGKVALQRGPVVYCLEQADNPAVPLTRAGLTSDSTITARHETSLLGGVTVLDVEGWVAGDDDWEGRLYRDEPSQEEPATLRAVPYFAWDNREPGEMLVWLRDLD